MRTVTIVDKEENEHSDKLVIMTFQYLQINSNKAIKSRKLNKDRVLIDTGSTCSVYNWKKMIINVKKSEKTLRENTNGGHQDSNLEGELSGSLIFGTTNNSC